MTDDVEGIRPRIFGNLVVEVDDVSSHPFGQRVVVKADDAISVSRIEFFDDRSETFKVGKSAICRACGPMDEHQASLVLERPPVGEAVRLFSQESVDIWT